MPLQQLVEYFNDRLEQEHNSGFRPFVLEHHQVHGLLGSTRVSSLLSPIRNALCPAKIIGHTAQLTVSTQHARHQQTAIAESLQDTSSGQAASIISFDRLTRAVHMLNYLPQAHLEKLLFLDVDPRHILGVKTDHGAYFEEIIIKCGLQTQNVTIVLTVDNRYTRYFQSLLKGLNNYQRRGYRIALKFNYQHLDKTALELIARAAPDFVGLPAHHNLQRLRTGQLQEKLQQLTGRVNSIAGKSILLNIEDPFSAELAQKTDFDLVEGSYFDQPEASAIPQPASYLAGNSGCITLP